MFKKLLFLAEPQEMRGKLATPRITNRFMWYWNSTKDVRAIRNMEIQTARSPSARPTQWHKSNKLPILCSLEVTSSFKYKVLFLILYREKRHPRIENGKWIWKRTRPEMGKVIHTKYKRQQCAGVYTHVHTCRNIYKIDFRRARRWGKGNNQDTLLRVSQLWDGDKETG